MARYLFISESPVVLSVPALPDLTAEFAASAVFTVWDSRTSGTNVSANLFNVANTALLTGTLTTDGNGVLPGFRGPDNMTVVWIDFGGGIARAPIVSSEIVKTIADAYIAGTLGGGGSGGSVTSGNITDSTQVGRQVLTAIDATAARNAIGAGTGSGTSSLVLGTTVGTAADGAHTHLIAAITGAAAALAAKVDSGSGPLVIYRVTTAGGALPTGTIADGSICIQPNA